MGRRTQAVHETVIECGSKQRPVLLVSLGRIPADPVKEFVTGEQRIDRAQRVLPHDEEPARHAPDLPQDRRHDPRARVLQLPRAGAAQGAAGSARGQGPWRLEWAHVLDDLKALQEIELTVQGKGYRLRTETKGGPSAVFGACGVALPPKLQSM
jgi:hypothetical protein